MTPPKTLLQPGSAPLLEPEFVDALKEIFEEKIVFNRVLGLKVLSLYADGAIGRIDMRPELVGHYAYNRVHGGAISAGLDRFTRLGTIDLRVDYLRPGIGDHFELHAKVLRLGSRVASTRMEFFGPDGTLMATGAGAYIVS